MPTNDEIDTIWSRPNIFPNRLKIGLKILLKLEIQSENKRSHAVGSDAGEPESNNKVAFTTEPLVIYRYAENQKSWNAHQIVDNIIEVNIPGQAPDVEQEAIVDDTTHELINHDDKCCFASSWCAKQIQYSARCGRCLIIDFFLV